jgi:hypothetical protein
MSAREWLPYDYFDEVIPPLRDSATDWIVSGPDFVATLASFDGNQGRVLAEGEMVPFLYHVDHGTAVLTIADDLSWSVSSPMPAEANSVYCAEIDFSGSNTIEGMVKDMAEFGALEPGTLEITFGYWSDQLPFRFDAAARAFVQVQS